MWLIFLQIWWLLLLFFPQNSQVCVICTGFFCGHSAKICHKKDSSWGCHQSHLYQKQNKSMNCFLSNAWWAKVPLSCQLEFGAVSGKARSMQAYVQCWVGTCFGRYCKKWTGSHFQNWTRIRSFQKELNHLCVEYELKSRKKSFFFKWLELRVDRRLIDSQPLVLIWVTKNWIEIGSEFWNGNQIPIPFTCNVKLRQFLVMF